MGTAARIPDTQQTLEKTSLYRRDYYTWARQQVAALKRRDFDAIDWENVTEEMQALVTSQESSLEKSIRQGNGALSQAPIPGRQEN